MEPLLEVRRGPLIESLHRGSIAVVDRTGDLIAAVGDPDFVGFLRSAAKPFQLLPFVSSGGFDSLGLAERHLALIASSHSGEQIHTKGVVEILERVGLDARALKCGTHLTFDDSARVELGNRNPTALHSNCSGKHAGMLAAAVVGGHTTHDYLDSNHPVQQAILEAIERFSDTPSSKIVPGVDGCTAPIFAIAIRDQAKMFARLASPHDFPDADARACKRISAAMMAHPEMVGATTQRLDTDLMRAGGRRVVAKTGAEGVQCLGILPCDRFPSGAGVAIKVEDGDQGGRGRNAIVAEVARQLLDLEVPSHSVREVLNRRGEVVGELRPVFNLL